MTVKLTLMNSFKRIESPSRERKNKKKSAVLFTKIAKMSRREQRRHSKEEEEGRKEGRNGEEEGMEFN